MCCSKSVPLIHVVSWLLYVRRTQTPTWHSRKCLGRLRDPTCACTRYLFPCCMKKRWRSLWRRVQQNTAAHLFLHELRKSVWYPLDHLLVWLTLKPYYVQKIHFTEFFACKFLIKMTHQRSVCFFQHPSWERVTLCLTALAGWRSWGTASHSSFTTRLWRLKRWCTVYFSTFKQIHKAPVLWVTPELQAV